jgi:hypothetical protein
MNRDQRRAAKKQRQMEERAMKTGKAKGMQKTGEILSDSIDGKDSVAKTGAPKKPLSLQSVKEESMRLREESLKNAAKRKKEGDKKQQLIGLPLEDEVTLTMTMTMMHLSTIEAQFHVKSTPHTQKNTLPSSHDGIVPLDPAKC